MSTTVIRENPTMHSYDPKRTLADLLEDHVEEYAADFRTYWQLAGDTPPADFDEATWRFAKLLDRVGSKLVPSARTLRLHPELADVLRTERLLGRDIDGEDSPLKHGLAFARAEIDLAPEAVARIPESEQRLGFVLRLLSEFELSERASAYVDRMVSCYVMGLDTEMVILARSVIEIALEDALDDDVLYALNYKRGKYGYHLNQRIEAARESSRIDEATLSMLSRIRVEGNQAVHSAPGLHENAELTLVSTVVCLRALFPVTRLW